MRKEYPRRGGTPIIPQAIPLVRAACTPASHSPDYMQAPASARPRFDEWRGAQGERKRARGAGEGARQRVEPRPSRVARGVWRLRSGMVNGRVHPVMCPPHGIQ